MPDFNTLPEELLTRIDRFKAQTTWFYESLVLPRWDTEPSRSTETLYAFVMWCFSQVDLLSGYWRGDISNNQSKRMADFLHEVMKKDLLESKLAVSIWRHKLMHTGSPRLLTDPRNGTQYDWLLHWADQIPVIQHFVVVGHPPRNVLNLSLSHLIGDLRLATAEYLSILGSDTTLKANFAKVERDLNSYSLSP